MRERPDVIKKTYLLQLCLTVYSLNKEHNTLLQLQVRPTGIFPYDWRNIVKGRKDNRDYTILPKMPYG